MPADWQLQIDRKMERKETVQENERSQKKKENFLS